MLNELREDIKQVTIRIIELAAERVELAKRVGQMKKQMGLPLVDSDIESNIEDVVLELSSKLNLNKQFSLAILELLINEAKKAQK